MKELPRTENPLVVRTDFSDEAAWEAICKAIREPSAEDGFLAYVDFLSDQEYMGLDPEQLRGLFPKRYDHSIIFLVDNMTLTHPESPILVVDLHDGLSYEGDLDEVEADGKEVRYSFRVVPTSMYSVENNLSLANMDFADYADSTGPDGIFRGFRRC